MDKEAAVHIYNGILLSHEKEHISVSSNKVDEPKEQTQNVAEINIRVHVSFRIVVFSGYMPSNEIAESRGSFIPPPLFFKKSPYCSPQ